MHHKHFVVCNFCDATCGLEVIHDGKKIISIKGDRENPFSRGHCCPKAQAHKDLYNDPNRLRHPVKRVGDRWEQISWNEAIREVGNRLAEVQEKHGNDSLAFYWGDPVAHNYATQLQLLPFIKSLKTKNVYSVNSVDSLPRMLVSYLLYGNQGAIPVPDIERTDYFLIIGANPSVSNGSVMTASNIKKRFKQLRERGSKIVLIDPRRNETAAIADAHHFIVPGTDAWFLLAMIHTLFDEDLIHPKNSLVSAEKLDALQKLVEPFPPERVESQTGIPANEIRNLARQFAWAKAAICYGRMGTSTQKYGSTATWLMDVINILTENLDQPGGLMFTTPPVDLARLAKFVGETGSFGKWKSRVSKLPEFNGELPVAALAEEIETPGPGQVKALLTLAGNICLSRPNTNRLLKAIEKLDYLACIDLYINETTRHANIILPPVCTVYEDHFETIFYTLAVRNTVNYSTAVFPKPSGTKEDWEILLELSTAIKNARGILPAALGRLAEGLFRIFSPKRQLDLLLRLGPHKLSLKKLENTVHGIDLGPLEPRLEKVLHTPDRQIHLLPEPFLQEVDRLKQRLDAGATPDKNQLLLIGRRSLKGLNSWLHNCPSLNRGSLRCTLLMHPDDAAERNLENGENVCVSTDKGRVVVELEVSNEMMHSVVSLPHGWGHDLQGAELSVAAKNPGVNANLLTEDDDFDEVSGTSVLYGISVNVSSDDTSGDS